VNIDNLKTWAIGDVYRKPLVNLEANCIGDLITTGDDIPMCLKICQPEKIRRSKFFPQKLVD